MTFGALSHHTPLLRASFNTGKKVWLKMDALQPTGSFKIRGIGRLCAYFAEQGAHQLVASSGGNAGLAAAYAASKLGLEARIFVPTTTPTFIRERMVEAGAQVEVVGDVWDETHLAASDFSKAHNCPYISPFDHPEIWAGHASLVHELAADLPGQPGAIVLSVGGGGLFCGVVQGLKEVGWGAVPVVAVETEGAASLAASMEKGELVELPAITSVAKSLGARKVSAQCMRCVDTHPIRSLIVSDKEAVEASLRFLDQQRVLVEPACGAALAPFISETSNPQLEDLKEVVVIVCGGAVITLEWLLALAEQFDLR